VVTAAEGSPVARVEWNGAVRIIRSLFPPIDLFEDIADPADWPLLLSAEQKTNPRIMETIGNLDLVPADRRVGGPGASYLMAPFTHVSPDRPSRFSGGSHGALYVAESYETALFETIHQHDLRGADPASDPILDPEDYAPAQKLAAALRDAGADGIVYPSVRHPGGECVALFHPDCASAPRQGRHLDYHWNGATVDLVRDAGSGAVFRVVEGGAG